jgi:hypothetical protein
MAVPTLRGMRNATTVAQWLVRITGLVQIVLGLLFWSGTALALIPVHMLVGLVLVLSLWTLAGLALAARVGVGLPIVALVWGLVVPLLGVMQDQLLPGDLHWMIRGLHLLVGLTAIVLAESLGARIRGRGNPWSGWSSGQRSRA